MILTVVPHGLDLESQLSFLAHLCPQFMCSLSRYIASNVLCVVILYTWTILVYTGAPWCLGSMDKCQLAFPCTFYSSVGNNPKFKDSCLPCTVLLVFTTWHHPYFWIPASFIFLLEFNLQTYSITPSANPAKFPPQCPSPSHPNSLSASLFSFVFDGHAEPHLMVSLTAEKRNCRRLDSFVLWVGVWGPLPDFPENHSRCGQDKTLMPCVESILFCLKRTVCKYLIGILSSWIGKVEHSEKHWPFVTSGISVEYC